MPDDLMAEQLAYYRVRAPEYDATAYPQARPAQARIAATVAGLRVRGSVLEFACGTGMWTRALASWTTELTAVDAAPEAIAIARRRCPATVRFEIADLLTWSTPRRYDVVFFAFWLSHVPPRLLPAFFERVSSWLNPGGRVIFVDEPPRSAAHENPLTDETVTRTLIDGSSHRIIKVFLDPDELTGRLAALGWTSSVADRGDWLVGQAGRR